MSYQKSFNFDQGNLGRNLELLDRRVHDWISNDIDEHTRKAEETMKTKAPWRDHTMHARESLWADNTKTDERYTIVMGQGAEYGVYLETKNEGRFKIVGPVMIATARSFMASLEHMFAQLEAKTRVTPDIEPTVTRPNTTRPDGIRVGVDKRGRSFAQDARGRFVSLKNTVKKTVTKRTKRTRRG